MATRLQRKAPAAQLLKMHPRSSSILHETNVSANRQVHDAGNLFRHDPTAPSVNPPSSAKQAYRSSGDALTRSPVSPVEVEHKESRKGSQPRTQMTRENGPVNLVDRAEGTNSGAMPALCNNTNTSLAANLGQSASDASRPTISKQECGKCGKRRRPAWAQSPKSTKAALQLLPQLQTVNMPTGINIEPPTAMTERAPTVVFSPSSTVSEAPLLREHGRPEKAARTGSISSLLRTLSRRKKSDNGRHARPAPPTSQGDRAVERVADARPSSRWPLSTTPPKMSMTEMNDMPKGASSLSRHEHAQFLDAGRPKHNRSQSTQTGMKQADYEDDVYLALPPDQRPSMTRFKSLRTGVNRAAVGLSRSASQITRSTSLRRLESVKKVPEFWYRNDMSLEGAGSEYNSYAY